MFEFLIWLFGDITVQSVLSVVIIGVAMRTLNGMRGKALWEFDFGLTGLTSVIGTLTGIGIIAPVFLLIPKDSLPIEYLTIYAASIMTVYGVDSLVKKAIKFRKEAE